MQHEKSLADICLLVPSKVSPSDACMNATLRPASERGARIVPESGTTDVALARCALVATWLRQRYAEGVTPPTWVCWVDDDMIISPVQFVELREVARELDAPVSARYVQRTAPWLLAARAIGEPSRFSKVVPGLEWPAVYAGMGCLMMTAEHLFALVSTSRVIHAERTDGSQYSFPAITQCGPCMGSDGMWHWASEDAYFSERCWSELGGLYLSHVEVGHLLDPAGGDAAWPKPSTALRSLVSEVRVPVAVEGPDVVG